MPWNSRFFQRDLVAFNTLHAERVTWYASALCSCGNTPDGPPNMSCAACGGLGYFYPTAGVTTRAVLTAIRQEEDLKAWGLTETGDLICDQPPGATSFAPWDLILTTWTQGEPFQGERLVRGSGTTDLLKFRAGTVYSCLQTDPATGVITPYTLNTDFTVSGKTVTWLGTANQPPAGSLYTLRYNATYEWVVLPPGLVRIERGTDLGPRTVLRKREIVLPNAPGALLPG